VVHSDAQIFYGKWRIEDFETQSEQFYFGADWGFSQDPTAAVECWIHGSDLYVHHEAMKIGLELDDTAKFVLAKIPGFDREVSRWDNSRPESISHLKRHGLPRAISVDKWKGSVEDGIAYMRSFGRIIIHPRCTSTITETRLYSYKVDRLTGDVTSAIVDAHNHAIDAIRYALSPMIRKRQQPASKLRNDVIGFY
jgi:phage terminase large subunit